MISHKDFTLPEGVWLCIPNNVLLVPQRRHLFHLIVVPLRDEAALTHHAYQVAELLGENAVVGRGECGRVGLEALFHYVDLASP